MVTGRVLRRLALALQLLFAATVLAQTGSLDSDTSTLLALKSSLGDPALLSSWNSGQNPCTAAWAGVNCTNGRVSSLGLSSLGLKGSLFGGLSSLDALAALDLSSNALTSTLPLAWKFASLQNMTLASNKLTGSLPPAWSSGMPKLQQLQLEGNSLQGTMPASWVNGTGFAQPFTATLQPGNAALCGPVSPAGGYTLIYDDASSGGQHTLTTTLGSCAQGTCGKAALNSSAPNLYDVSWANTASALDVAATNTDIQLNSVPLAGTPVELPCYPSGPPTFFGSNVAYLKATWQSTTDGTQTSSLAVAGQGRPGTTDACSTTTDSPGWWMVDLQQSTPVQAVLLYAGADMATVEVRVGDSRDPTANALCTSRGAKSREGFISVCDTILTGRYVSVVATQSRLSLCRVEVYSLATNAALGKYTAASSGNAAAVTDGSAADNSCSSVVSRQDLSTWITVDLGYSASVSTVVIANGASTFNGDLTIRLGNTEVTQGDENAPCTQSLTISSGYTLPVQCLGTGRYLTLWVQRAQASTMYICEIYIYLAAGPTSFGNTSPYIPPPSPPPSPYSPSPSGPIDASVDASTTVLDTILLLTGSGLNPLTPQTQQKIVTAMTDVWTPANGITDVTFVQYSSNSQSSVAVELYVGTPQGQAPAAAQFMVQSANNGDLAKALAKEGVSVSTAAVTSIAAYQASPSPSPSSPDNNNSSGGGSSTPVGAIVGGVVGGVAVIAAVLAFLLVRRRRQRQRAAASPKALAAMEQGRLGGQFGGKENGGGVDVAARTGGSKVLVPDPALVTEGPSEDVLNFLTADPPEAHAALFDAASQTGNGNGTLTEGEDSPTRGGGLTPAASESISVTSRLLSNTTLARMGSSVSELWLVDWSELQLQKQIGEGSFGKVHLAKWRETTVAVKVLSNAGLSDSMEEEFPEQGGSPGQRHPLYESLQKEAAMMAALRHPSIVMYLGVCLDPPAVVTEYCARGSLNDVLKRARSSPSLAAQLDWPRRLNMALDAAKGLLYLHSCNPPIIHRDLKSPNLLVDKHWRVKVGDFNLSRVMEDSVVLSSVAATNPRWLAPEILAGKGYTYASDVYAFGIILWEFLTWQVPWHEYGPWQVVAMVTESSKRPEVPEVDELPTPAFAGLVDYLHLMQECWAQDPTQRPSFATVISRLRKLLALEAQRQRQNSAAAESPSKHSTADGSETPQMRSRPIVSIYDLSGGAASDLPAPIAIAGSLGASGEVVLTASLARSEGGLTGSLMTLDTEAGARRLETIRGGSSDDGAAER